MGGRQESLAQSTGPNPSPHSHQAVTSILLQDTKETVPHQEFNSRLATDTCYFLRPWPKSQPTAEALGLGDLP